MHLNYTYYSRQFFCCFSNKRPKQYNARITDLSLKVNHTHTTVRSTDNQQNKKFS